MNDNFDDEQSEEARSAQIRGALLKALAVVVVIGVFIALGTTIVVRALGLNDGDSRAPVGAASSAPEKPLPTKAIPQPGEKTAKSDEEQASKSDKTNRIQLAISPALARPMERVNLTGTYKGADNVGLQVQRLEDGSWQNFGVDATVHVGTYETYIMTGRPGEQRFRMYDPQRREGSNVVLVTID